MANLHSNRTPSFCSAALWNCWPSGSKGIYTYGPEPWPLASQWLQYLTEISFLNGKAQLPLTFSSGAKSLQLFEDFPFPHFRLLTFLKYSNNI